ncbi:MAG: alginate export family protein [Bryobacterales bacterium]|nr:alginate export family protein [Bryobacterales bacterium]
MKQGTGIVCLLMAAAGLLPAQPKPPEPLKLGSVVVQGSIRTRMEAWNWFDADPADSSYAFSGTLLRLSFGQSRRSLDWQFELAAPILLGLPDNSVAPGAAGLLGMGANYFTANGRNRNSAMVFPKQAYIRLKGLLGDDSRSLRVGRFEFLDGTEITPKNATLAALKRDRMTQRLLGNFGWTHVGRSFDGLHYVQNIGKASLHVMGAIPTRGVFQTDGWGWVRTGFGYASLNGQHNGKRHSGDWRVFGLYYHDFRHGVLKTDNRAVAARLVDQANIRIPSFGGHYLHLVETSSGPVDVLLWGLAQTGNWGLQDHRAFAGQVEAGWQPKVWAKAKPWIRGGYLRATGDQNAGDGLHGTFFQALPTPRPYARFPFFNFLNNEDAFAELILRPSKKVTLRGDFHNLRLSSRSDLWYLGGGAFQPWSFGYIGRTSNGERGLGKLVDASVDYVLNAHVSLSFYGGYAPGGKVAERIYPRGKNAGLGYVELTYKF